MSPIRTSKITFVVDRLSLVFTYSRLIRYIISAVAKTFQIYQIIIVKFMIPYYAKYISLLFAWNYRV